ncbi:MAG: Wzt carbohydrate-binding domain-containing protein, partial [Anaerolineae bacterium]|nr:Wzt carbohydrate-binding domain-containing protein [Anaerolineae bacterium]
TVLFVSHNMDAVQKLCTRAVLLNQGSILQDDNSTVTVSSYLEQIRSKLQVNYEPDPTTLCDTDNKSYLAKAEILNANEQVSSFIRFREPFTVKMLWVHKEAIPAAHYSIRVTDRFDRLMFATNNLEEASNIDLNGTYEVKCRFDTNVLTPGEYQVSIGCYVRPHTTIHKIDPCFKLKIENIPYYSDEHFNLRGNPAFSPRSTWNLRKSKMVHTKNEERTIQNIKVISE